MSTDLVAVHEAARLEVPVIDDSLSLVERAEGLGRAAVMEEVLGPHLDAMLRPIYEAAIDPEEKTLPSLQGEFPLRVLDRFFERLRSILEDRFNASVRDGPEYEELLELNEQRKDLLFFTDEPIKNINEAFGTSIGVPLALASWITDLERPKGWISPYRDVDGMAEIMQREAFRRILLRLTKGPNEFLGKGSDRFQGQGSVFFYGLGLPISEAFDMEDGQVVDLSGAYAVAADRRRKRLRARELGWHKGNDSSGCPVSHSFEDADGNPQSSLVVTGNEFAVAAMRYAEQLPLELSTRS